MGFDGDVQNLYPLARPEPLSGMVKAFVWFGDPCVFLLSTKSESKKGKGLVIASYVVSLVVVTGFYLLFAYTYGAALKDVGAAFSRVLLANRSASEIGALDWPIMTVWLAMSFFHCSLLFAACKECFVLTFDAKKRPKSIVAVYVLLPLLSFLLYFFLFKNIKAYVSVLTLGAVAITVGVLEYATPLLSAILIKAREKRA